MDYFTIMYMRRVIVTFLNNNNWIKRQSVELNLFEDIWLMILAIFSSLIYSRIKFNLLN